jgi:hypothetical protein
VGGERQHEIILGLALSIKPLKVGPINIPCDTPTPTDMPTNRFNPWIAALLIVLTGSVRPLSAQAVHGIVFNDANGNGMRDAAERGLRGIIVSNQDAVVTTGSTGNFTLDPGPAGLIFVSVPNGYRAVGSFWRRAADTTPLTFALQPSRQPGTFQFIHASDTHLSAASIERTRRFRSLADSIKPAFALLAGDLIRDAMSATEQIAKTEFELFVSETKQFSTPLFPVPGNHDHFALSPGRSGATTGPPTGHPLFARKMYHHYLGPDYYSFNYAGVHFIGLNTLQRDDSAYYGSVDSVQLAWLARDVAQIPATMPIVTFNHIPLASALFTLEGYYDAPYVSSVARVNGVRSFRHTVANTRAVLEVLKGHSLLALGAHSHSGEKISFETDAGRLRFEQSAAIIGRNQLAPVSLPSGFTLYTVRSGEIDAGVFVRMDPPARTP